MKKIMWENWNEKEIELADGMGGLDDTQDIDMNAGDELFQAKEDIGSMGAFLTDLKSPIIYTPFGSVPSESALKPSDRWQCWLGYTNFDLTHKISDRMKIVNGVEALRIMSRYTFCIGVGKLFNFSNVRKEIEDVVCK
jgi:hypothetical protein